jgi:heme/copper-type cytochrome/quinol oxidase subunit 4
VPLPFWILCSLLLMDQLVPTLPFYAGVAPSMALGMSVAAGACIIALLACWAIRARAIGVSLLDANANGLMLIGTVVVVTILHGAVADQLQNLDWSRFAASLIPLVLLLGGGLALGTAMRDASERTVARAVRLSFWVLCIIGLCGAVGLQPPHVGKFPKSTFPFTETSHFVLAFAPVYLYMCATARRGRRDLWLLLGFALALVLKSATLLAVAVVAALICRRFVIVLVSVLIVAAAGLTVQFKYFTARAALSDDSSNLSALVYLEGWEMLDDSLVRSHGWGVGFEQLGLRGSNVPAAAAIRSLIEGEDLNLKDGSFVLAKVGSEFGAAGLVLVALYALFALKCLLALRSGRGSLNQQFARSVILAYWVDMFVRGTGYFSQSTFLFVAACLALAPAGGLLALRRSDGPHKLLVLR